MDSVNITPPSIGQVGMSLSGWLLLFLSVGFMRMEMHPWVNVIALVGLLPGYVWFISQNNVISFMTQPAIFGIIAAAMLFMTLLLEAKPKSSFSRSLKKYFKEYGKSAKETTYASLTVIVSLVIGFALSFYLQGNNFIRV